MQTTSVSHSDHLVLLISLTNTSVIQTCKKTTPKRFEPHWIKEDECLEVFDKLWIPDPSSSVDSVRINFGSILDHLLEWSKKKYGNLPLKIKQIK